MSVELIANTFLENLVAQAAPGTALNDCDVHDTAFGLIVKPHTIQIGPCESRLAPSFDGGSVEEFDARLVLIILARVGNEKTAAAYTTARDEVMVIAVAIARAVMLDSQLGGRVRDCLLGKIMRTFTSVNNYPFALANLPLFINQTGQAAELQK